MSIVPLPGDIRPGLQVLCIADSLLPLLLLLLLHTLTVTVPPVQQPVPATVPVTFVDDVRLVKGATPALKKTVWAWWANGAGMARIDVVNLDAGGGGGRGRRMLSE